jgi:hypothetical protein
MFSNYRKGKCVELVRQNKKKTMEDEMNSKKVIGTSRKDAAITQRYGKIGIPAVAAAARCQGKDKKGSTADSRTEGKSMERNRTIRGTSPHR